MVCKNRKLAYIVNDALNSWANNDKTSGLTKLCGGRKWFPTHLKEYLRCRIHRPARIANNQITQRIELAAITPILYRSLRDAGLPTCLCNTIRAQLSNSLRRRA